MISAAELIEEFWLEQSETPANALRRMQAMEKYENFRNRMLEGRTLEEDDEKKKLKRRGVMRLISLPIAIVSVVAFWITENIALPTGFVDRWTLLMVIIVAIQTVVVAFSRKKEMEDGERARA